MKMYNTIIKEAILYENEKLDKSVFDNYKENIDFKIDRLTKYNAEYWNGYNVIAPDKAIRDFEIKQ